MKSTEAKTTTERGCPSRSNVRSQGTAPKAQPLDEGRDLLRLGQPRSVAAISISARLRRLVAFLIVILALASRVVAATCSSPPTNLIGWWPGDGNANDIVSTNNGFLQGGATASGAGFVSSAFTFDGTNGFVQIPNSASLRPTNLTIEAWVRFSGLDSAGSGGSPAGDQYIVFRQNTRSTDFEGFDLSKTRVGGSDVFRFLIASASGQAAEIRSSTTISTGLWYHVAAVRGSNFTQIYVNGVLERGTNVSFAQDYGNFPLYFGTSGASVWDHKLKGNLDEVSIYNRPLSGAEITAIYTAGSAGKCKSAPCVAAPAGLASWWYADGNANDIVGGLNGTVVNGTAFVPGKKGQAFSFDGVSNYITNKSPGISNITNTYTMEFWAWPSANRASTTETTTGFVGISNQRYAIFPNNGGYGTVGSGVSVGTNGVSVFEHGAAYLSSLLAYDAPIIGWTHIAVVYVNQQPSLYINGALVRTGLVSTRASYPSTSLGEIGAGYGYYGGLLDEVSIYNRALSAAEIQAIYQADSSGKCPPPPIVLTHPADQSAFAGFSAGFSVLAGGVGPFGYQWRFNGTNIAGATNSTLTLQNVQAAQQGLYSVTIANAGGSIVSSNASLSILTPPAGVPVISSFTPASTNPSANVVISGTNFSPIASSNIVFFGAVRAQVISATPTSLSVIVPLGATYAPISVAVNGSIALSKIPFKPTFLGDGSGISSSTFPVRQDLPGADGPFITVIADLDGDGKPDLAIANVYAHSISLYRNIGTNGSLSIASFASRVDLPGFGGPSDNPHGFTAADVDGDGKIDLIITDRGFNVVRIYRNLSTPGTLNVSSFSADISFPTGVDPRGVRVHDLDGDGRPDIVVCNYGDGTISILRNVSAPGVLDGSSFAPRFDILSGAGTYNVAIQDLDGDGRPDLAVVNGVEGTVCVLRNLSSPGSLNGTSFGGRVNFPAPSSSQAMVVGDMDGDGLPDLITGGSSQLFSIYRNTATPGSLSSNSFAGRLDYGNPGWVHNVALSDLNGDGKLAVAVVGELASFFSAFRNQSSPGAISLASAAGYSTGWNPWGVSIGDLDGDGRPDVVFCNAYDDTISLYRNETPFGGPPNIITQPTNVAAGIGGTAIFGTTVMGQAPLAYVWKRNGTNLLGSSRITGATNSNLTIAHLQSSDAGSYSLVVTNSLGVATSSVAVLTILNPPPCASFSSDLVGWWQAENSTADIVAGLNGAIAGYGTFGYSNGVVGQAFVFDGIHRDRVDLGNPTNLQIQDFTIEAWIKRSDANDIALDDLNQDGAVSGEGGMVLAYGRNGYGFALYNSGQLILSKIDVDGVGSSGVVHDTNWHHVAVTKLGATTFFYIDGLPASGPITYNTTYTFDTSISIGSRGDARGGTFFGMVDEPAIYKRALSSSEILALYNSGATGKCPLSPLVISPPTNQTVLGGYTASFTVQIAGSPPFTYAWLFNGSPLSNNSHTAGADTPSVSVSNAQSADAGSYSVVISNSVGSVTSSVAALTVQFAAPTFSTQPQNQAGVSGTNISFSALATGSLPIAYQWFFNSNSLSDGGRITGATSPSLTISNCNTNDTGPYFAIASNSAGFGTSTVASLFVGLPPTILQSPVSQTNLVGTNLTFTVQADGTPPLSYAWRRNGGNLSDGPRVFGSTNSTLVLSNVLSGDAGNYDVVVSNPSGSATSAVAVLTLVAPPSISGQPSGRLTFVGLPVTFSAGAAGTPPLTYQWQFNGVDIPSQTTATYTISSVAASNFGLYRLVVTNDYGFAISSNALLGQSTIASWGGNSYPIPVSATNVIALSAGNNSANASHVLALRADGTIVSWGNNGNGQTNVPSSATNIVAVAAGGSHSLALRADGTLLTWGNNMGGTLNIPSTLSNVVAIAAGTFDSVAIRADGKVVVWGNNGISGLLVIPSNLVKTVTIAAGNTHNLATRSDGTVVSWGSNTDGRGPSYAPPSLADVSAVSAGTLHSVALRSNNTIYAWSSTSALTNLPVGLSNNVLAVSAGDGYSLALRSDGRVAGWGTVTSGATNVPAYVSNAVAIAAGSLQALALLGDGRPLITRQPVGGSSWLGRNFTLSAVAIGQPPLSYQWQSNNVDISGATNAMLTLNNLSLANATNYRLIVSNAFGVASSVPVPLTVLDNNSLTFLSQPASSQFPSTNYQGQRLVLTAGILGNGPLTYQWKFNGANIPAGTNEDLIFDPVLVSNAGNYSLSVTNPLNFFANSLTSSQRVVQVKAWGYLSNEPPVSLTNAISIASGYAGEGSILGPYLALKSDGKIVGWGNTLYGTTNPPPSVTNSFITAIAAGYDDALALRYDGTVAAWGYGVYGQTNPPASAVNVTAVACGDYHDLALRSDGTVVTWGGQVGTGLSNVPPSATNIIAISAGAQHSLALRANGTVAIWGITNGMAIRANATNIIAISAGTFHNLALRADGTIVQWPIGGQFPFLVPPTNLNNVVAIAAGYSHDLALLSDGNLVSWGSYYSGPATIAQDIANVIQISTRGDRDLALFGTRAPAVTVQPFDRIVFKGSNTTFNAKAVGVQPVSYQWQVNGTNIPGATFDSLTLTNLQFAQSGPYQLIASNRYGLGSSRTAKLSVTIPLPEALDTTNVTWASSGSALWFGEPDISHDGIDAARSGSIGNGQESVLQTTLAGPAQLSFWWKVSSEQSFDFLEFKLDGVTQASISGEVDWQQRSYVLSTGSHTLQWRYSKDASNSGGQDAAWVDQFIYAPDPPLITAQPVDVTTNAGATARFQVSATGISPLTFQWRQNGSNSVGIGSNVLLINSVTRSNNGLYSVLVSNIGGITVSSNALLKVIVPQRFSSGALIANGSVMFLSGDSDGGLLTSNDLSAFTAQGSSNLVDWVNLPNALSITNGLLLLQDPNQSSYSSRFYRIIEQ